MCGDLTMHFVATQPGNPHQLTKGQHIFPVASLKRFCNSDGKLEARDTVKHTNFPVTPGAAIFKAKRAWDQRAESGYMKRIEDGFNKIAVKIISLNTITVNEIEAISISLFYALWYFRSRNFIATADFSLKGVCPTTRYTEDEQERLERAGIAFIQGDASFPGRTVNGVAIQMKINRFIRDNQNVKRWGVLRSLEGEFLIPDVPKLMFIPISPNMCLIASKNNGVLWSQNVEKINTITRSTCRRYFFARNLVACP